MFKTTDSFISPSLELQSSHKRGRKKDPKKLDAILKSASGHFLSYGYQNTSLIEIAKHAGVSRVTIYSYFPSKLELFKACIAHASHHIFHQVSHELDSSSSIREVLTHFGANIIFLLRNPLVLASVRLIIGLVPEISPNNIQNNTILGVTVPNDTTQKTNENEREALKLVRQQYFEQSINIMTNILKQHLTQAQKSGQLKIDDVEFAASIYISLFCNHTYHAMLFDIETSPSALHDQSLVHKNVDFFLKAYAPSQPS